MKSPILSVVMPVYNGQEFLKEAIDSVLNQTFSEFELLIIDDGSTDSSNDIILAYQDSRIRFIKNDKNRGISYTRNRGLVEAKGQFLAWMDCDDISLPERLQVQLNFLLEHPDIGICGTLWWRIGEGKPRVRVTPENSEEIKASLLFYPAVNPATAMMRMKFIRDFNLTYDERLKVAEDYNFFFDACFCFPIYNIQKPLYYYRLSNTSIMEKFSSEKSKILAFHKIIFNKGFINLNIDADEEKFFIHNNIRSSYVISSWKEYIKFYDWLKFLFQQNLLYNVYDEESFRNVLSTMFYFISKKSSQMGLKVFIFFINNNKIFANNFNGSLLKLFVRCVIKYNKF